MSENFLRKVGVSGRINCCSGSEGVGQEGEFVGTACRCMNDRFGGVVANQLDGCNTNTRS